jgi:Chromate transporter
LLFLSGWAALPRRPDRASLGYFHDEFVVRRRWLDEKTYVDLVALCQFLPGPASSKVGIAIGLARAGYAGALSAWCGFTLPSAVAVVAQAVLAMMRSLGVMGPSSALIDTNQNDWRRIHYAVPIGEFEIEP